MILLHLYSGFLIPRHLVCRSQSEEQITALQQQVSKFKETTEALELQASAQQTSISSYTDLVSALQLQLNEQKEASDALIATITEMETHKVQTEEFRQFCKID